MRHHSAAIPPCTDGAASFRRHAPAVDQGEARSGSPADAAVQPVSAGLVASAAGQVGMMMSGSAPADGRGVQADHSGSHRLPIDAPALPADPWWNHGENHLLIHERDVPGW